MTDNEREKIALFRFGLISPILNGQVINQKEYLVVVTAKVHNVPYYGPKKYVPKNYSRLAHSLLFSIHYFYQSYYHSLIS